jgi:hypothetical protein
MNKPTLCCLFTFSLAARALASGYEPSMEFKFSGSRDSNAYFDRSDQYIPVPIADHIDSFGLKLDEFFRPWHLLTTYKFDLADFQKLSDLSYTAHSLDISYRNGTNEKLSLVPELELEYHEENNRLWDYSLYNPSLFLSYDFSESLSAQARYNFTGREFIDTGDKDNYQNINSLRHDLNAVIKYWHSAYLRSSAGCTLDYRAFGGNLAPSLEIYSGLHRGTDREDRTGALRLEETAVFSDKLLGSLAYEYSDKNCNSDRYACRVNRTALGGLFQSGPHGVYFEWATPVMSFTGTSSTPGIPTRARISCRT